MLLPLKIPILFAETIFIWKAFTPPHTSSQAERLPSTLIGRFAVTGVTFMKIAHVVNCLCETILIISYHNQDAPLSQLALSTFSRPLSTGARGISVTPIFLIGSLLAIAGAQLRLACYRALGRLFTFEMSVRSGHKLITDGPYAYVRHPAYSGLVLTMLGEAVVQFGKGSWLRECGWMGTVVGQIYFVVLIVPMMLISYSVSTRRLWNEERALRDRFEDDWEKWAKDTPYKMIPFVY